MPAFIKISHALFAFARSIMRLKAYFSSFCHLLLARAYNTQVLLKCKYIPLFDTKHPELDSTPPNICLIFFALLLFGCFDHCLLILENIRYCYEHCKW